VNVTVRLFARAKELAGADRLVVELADASRIGDLREHLVSQDSGLASLAPHLIFAVGTDYVGDDAPIPPGKEVAAIPPVSGG
jgi:molybdopterin converting factor subunit 1